MTLEEFLVSAEPDSTVYEIRRTCAKLCEKYSDLVQKYPNLFKCTKDSPCCSCINEPSQWSYKYLNKDELHKKWGITLFATADEAIKAGCKLIENNIAIFVLLGCDLDEKGRQVRDLYDKDGGLRD